ncbi:MAG: hypothetical protein SCK57_13310, partial [Bacillota bacterium]|nr:hypothetical protein [Bacillota bacterium]
MNPLAPVTLQPLRESREFLQLADALKTREHTLGAYGLIDSQKPHFAAALQHHQGGQLLLLTETETQARQLAEDLNFYLGKNTQFFPARQPVLYDAIASDVSTGMERLKTLQFLSQQKPAVITAPMEALFMKLPPPELFRRLRLTFTLGETVRREDMLRTFMEQGYQRAEQVEEKGRYSIRGDIIDIFPPTEESPLRIELFDDEVDSIRRFDLLTQQSIEKIASVTIYPATEWILDDAGRARVIDTLQRMKAQAADPLSTFDNSCGSEDRCSQLIGRLTDTQNPHDLEGLQDLAYAPAASLLDYLAPESLVLLDEPQRLRHRSEGVTDEWREHFTLLLERRQALPVQAHCLFTPPEITARIKAKTVITLHLLPRNEKEFPAQTVVNFVTRSVPSFQGKMNWLFDELRGFARKQYRIVLLAAGKEKALKLLDALREAGVPVQYLVEQPQSQQEGYSGDGGNVTQGSQVPPSPSNLPSFPDQSQVPPSPSNLPSFPDQSQ